MDNSNVDIKNKVQWLNKKWEENKKDIKGDNREEKEEDNSEINKWISVVNNSKTWIFLHILLKKN